MPTIKGGIRFDPKGDNSDFLRKLTEAGAPIKLPFKATGFKSSKMPEGVNIEEGIFGPAPVKSKEDVVEKPVEETESSEELSFTEDELKSKSVELGFRSFRRWARDAFGVTGRSVKGLIKDILDSIGGN